MHFVHRSVMLLLGIPLSPLQSLGTAFMGLQEGSCSVLPAVAAHRRWDRPARSSQAGSVHGCPILHRGSLYPSKQRAKLSFAA